MAKKITKKIEEKQPEKVGKIEEKQISSGAKLAEKTEAEKKPEEAGEKERIEILKKFTKAALKKYGPIIRSIVLFGSTARKEFKEISDIDVFIIIDDTKTKITPGLKSKIESDLDVIAKSTSKLLSIQQPYLLTEFWRLVREGHPIIFNFIREGIPVYDKDIFLPIKKLLQMGEIIPSKEAVEKLIERAPKRISRIENAKIYMVVEDCYYAMLESAQAALMFMGKSPPRPVDAPNTLRRTLVKMKLLDEKYVKYLEDVIELRKKVEHTGKKDITGADVDVWIEKTKEFVKKMQDLLIKLEMLKRKNMIEKSHAIMKETVMTVLKALNKLPKSNESIADAFKKHLVDTGYVSENYLNALTKLEKMRELLKQGKIFDIQKQDIIVQREYVRKFIREAGKILKKKLNVEENQK